MPPKKKKKTKDVVTATAAAADAAVAPAGAAPAPPMEPYFGANGEATARAASLPPLRHFEQPTLQLHPPCSRRRGNLLLE